MRKFWFVGLALLLMAGCVPVSPPAVQPDAARPGAALSIMAAASLKEAFEAIGADFTAQHPETTVTFSFAGSQQLAQQLVEGAPGDVFAAANVKQMGVAVAGGRLAAEGADAPALFAHNRLVVVVPADNPAGIESLRDLAKPDLKLVLAAETVPAGQYALEFLAKASATAEFTAAYSPTVLSNVVSYETNVRSVLTKVALGEADAGIVYATDAPPDNTQVMTLPIPDALNVLADYPIGVVLDSAQLQTARDFVSYVLSAEGQATLARFGFLGAEE